MMNPTYSPKLWCSSVVLGAIFSAAPALGAPVNADTVVQATVASTSDVVIPNLAVRERLEAIEQINVTAEKTPLPLHDAELEAIINAAQALETDDVGEHSADQ